MKLMLALCLVGIASVSSQEPDRVYDVQVTADAAADKEIGGELPKFKPTTLAFSLTLILARQPDAPTEAAADCPNVTLFATNSHAIRVVGPFLLDTLSLGALNLAYRTNDSSTVVRLSYPPELQGLLRCGDEDEASSLEEEVTSLLLSKVLKVSEIEDKDWTIQVLDGLDNDFNLNEMRTVLLFSTNGLFAIFTVFMTLTLIVLCCNTRGSVLSKASNLNAALSNPILNVLMLAVFASSVLLLFVFLISFVFDSVLYYMGYSIIDDALFSDKLFSPFTVHIVFLGLTTTVALIGGFCFAPKNANFGMKERIGMAMFYTLLSVAVYHSVFVIVTLFVDFLTVITSLLIFLTMFLLLVLSFASVIQQFRNENGFSGFLFLVAAMHSIIMSLYGILLTSLSLLVTQDTSVYNGQCFAIVLVVSIMAVSFCLSIFVLIARKGYKSRHSMSRQGNRKTGQRVGTSDHGAGGEDRAALVPRRNLVVVPREVEILVKIAPTVVMEAWGQMKKQRQD